MVTDNMSIIKNNCRWFRSGWKVYMVDRTAKIYMINTVVSCLRFVMINTTPLALSICPVINTRDTRTIRQQYREDLLTTLIFYITQRGCHQSK